MFDLTSLAGFSQAFLYCSLAVLVFMTLLFLVALVLRNNSIVDIGWGLGFILVALLTLFWKGEFTFRPVLVTVLVLVWGLRLAVRILIRNWRKPEDFRYAAWRRSWGRWFVVRSFFQIFMFQGLLLLLISVPVIWVNTSEQAGAGLMSVLGFMVWVAGFFFEALADYQLDRFKRDPGSKGKLLTSGLWKYSRHPNYFGEALMWWGIFVIGLAVPGGWLGIISPLLITALLRWVSGVPMLEKKYAGNEDFEAYAARTNAFFPWRPKRGTFPQVPPLAS